MPSKSGPQHNLMAARANGATFPMAKKVPLGVAKDFMAADKTVAKKFPGIQKQGKASKGPHSSHNNAPSGDNRAGRIQGVKTDRGAFRFKANRKGD